MKIIAHRGYSGLYPENTLLSIEKALETGCDGIEIDVYRAEDTLVVIHDSDVSRTTNGLGLVSDFSLAALQKLDAGCGQPVPTLWQVLALCNNQLELNIELKGSDTAALLVKELKKAQQELGTQLTRIVVSSFNHHLLRAVQTALPQLRLGALTASLALDYARFASELKAFSIHCDEAFVNAELVADAHQRNLEVWVYTVNSERRAQELKTLGVDAIFCNYPKEAMEWLLKN